MPWFLLMNAMINKNKELIIIKNINFKNINFNIKNINFNKECHDSILLPILKSIKKMPWFLLMNAMINKDKELIIIKNINFKNINFNIKNINFNKECHDSILLWILKSIKKMPWLLLMNAMINKNKKLIIIKNINFNIKKINLNKECHDSILLSELKSIKHGANKSSKKLSNNIFY